MGRMRELFEKHGKVAVGVHLSISTATVAAHYVAIKKNVDFTAIFQKLGITPPQPPLPPTNIENKNKGTSTSSNVKKKKKEEEETKAEILVSSLGALGMALLCNKALYPVRAPITFLLTPPLSSFLKARFK